MSGVTCDECGKEINVTITGGKFQVRDGSTLDNLNFQKIEDIKIITLDEVQEESIQKLNEDTELTIHVCCSVNPDHMVFTHTVSRIKREIYKRIKVAAMAGERKHFSA